jgi:hypothetical protein
MAEFMPQNTIVITPEKMTAFYSHHRLDVEVFPYTGLSIPDLSMIRLLSDGQARHFP